MIYWFFGFPGAGKDYCAKIFNSLIDAKYLHLDEFLTKEERKKLLDGTFTIEDRLNKLKRITKHIKKNAGKYPNIVATDSLPDHRSRQYIANKFKNEITLILVKISPKVHKKRIQERKNHFFTEDILNAWIKKHWAEPIQIPYLTLNNDEEGDEYIKVRLKKIYSLANRI